VRENNRDHEYEILGFSRAGGGWANPERPLHFRPSAGFEPAVEVLQTANCSSPEFAEVS